MKILIVTQYFWSESFRINNLALSLQERSHEVTVLTGMPNYPYGRFFEGYGFLPLFDKAIEALECIVHRCCHEGGADEAPGWTIEVSHEVSRNRRHRIYRQQRGASSAGARPRGEGGG
jgi:hypothetical protein